MIALTLLRIGNEDLVYAIAEDVQRALVLDAREYASLKQVITPDFDEVIVSEHDILDGIALGLACEPQ